MTYFLREIGQLGCIAALLLTGCYSDRWTGNYDEIPELDAEHQAVLETSETSEADRQKQIEELQRLAKEPIPAFTLHGGDKVEIVVYTHPDLSVKTVITPDGFVGMVLVGQIKIAGLTLAEASAKIEKELSRYIRNPRVGVSPYEIVSNTVTIAGAVKDPGIFPISHGMRLTDLFARAGGTLTQYYDSQPFTAADFNNSIFIRNNKIVPLDFIQALERGNPLHNLQLRNGDYIFIATRENSMVYLLGAVQSPGKKVWTRDLRLLELIAFGKGLQDIHWSHAIIIRGSLAKSKMYKVNLDGILCGAVSDVALLPGDIVYIPHDNISEYNVFIKKLMPTAQLINMLMTPGAWAASQIP